MTDVESAQRIQSFRQRFQTTSRADGVREVARREALVKTNRGMIENEMLFLPVTLDGDGQHRTVTNAGRAGPSDQDDVHRP